MSPEILFDTTTAAATPALVKVTYDSAVPSNSTVVIYRSIQSFAAGDNVEIAEYPDQCTPAGCAAGDAFFNVSGHVPANDFTATTTALPVKLQEFSVD